MASESVTVESLPPFKLMREDSGFDKNDAGESARWALNGIEAISTIIMENINGETKGHWSDDFIWHLHQGQEALSAFTRQQVEALQHELWYTHALLGDYGQDAKKRAESKLEAAALVMA